MRRPSQSIYSRGSQLSPTLTAGPIGNLRHVGLNPCFPKISHPPPGSRILHLPDPRLCFGSRSGDLLRLHPHSNGTCVQTVLGRRSTTWRSSGDGNHHGLRHWTFGLASRLGRNTSRYRFNPLYPLCGILGVCGFWSIDARLAISAQRLFLGANCQSDLSTQPRSVWHCLEGDVHLRFPFCSVWSITGENRCHRLHYQSCEASVSFERRRSGKGCCRQQWGDGFTVWQCCRQYCHYWHLHDSDDAKFRVQTDGRWRHRSCSEFRAERWFRRLWALVLT